MARLFVPLDVNFPDDDKIEAAGLAGAGLYAMSLCVAKRTLTDGRLTRVKLRKLGADDALIDRCIEVGLYTRDADDAVRITAWLGWNAPAESVLSSEKGKHLAHLRHHAQKGVVNPSCRYCMDPTLEEPQVNAGKCAEDADRTEPQCADALPEVEVETETTPSSLRTTHEQPDEATARDDEQQPVVDEQTVRRTAALVGRAIADQAGAANPSAYAATVTASILTGDDPTDRDRITAALGAGETPETIAAGWVPDPLATVLELGGARRTEPAPARPPIAAFDPARHEAEAEAQRQALEALEAR